MTRIVNKGLHVSEKPEEVPFYEWMEPLVRHLRESLRIANEEIEVLRATLRGEGRLPERSWLQSKVWRQTQMLNRYREIVNRIEAPKHVDIEYWKTLARNQSRELARLNADVARYKAWFNAHPEKGGMKVGLPPTVCPFCPWEEKSKLQMGKHIEEEHFVIMEAVRKGVQAGAEPPA